MKYILNAEFMNTKEEAHEYLNRQFDLPEYYGKNLDALHDCLSEWNDVQIEILNMPEDKSSYVWKVWKVMKRANVLAE